MRGSRRLDNLGRLEVSAPGKVIEEPDTFAHQNGNKMYLHLIDKIRMNVLPRYVRPTHIPIARSPAAAAALLSALPIPSATKE
jgi:hypothetical protein